MTDLRAFWWLFAFRGAFAILFAALLAFAGSLLGTIFFDPIMLVYFSLLLGFFVLGNGILLVIGAIYSLEHHVRFWWMMLGESILALALGAYIAASLRTTSHSLAYLAGLHAIFRLLFQFHLAIKLRDDRAWSAFIATSGLISLLMAALFLLHRDDSIRTISVWLSSYEAVFGSFTLCFAIVLHRNRVIQHPHQGITN